MPVSLTAAEEAAPPTAVAFNRVSLAFDEAVVLRELSFSIPKGSMRMLLGASGSGKSVVLKLILGLLKPDSGSIEVNGQRIDTMTEHELLRVRADIGMVFQENALFDSLTVAENVGYRLTEEAGLSAAEVQARVEEVLGFIGLGEYMDRLPSELSGGQRRRVAIARAMAPEPGLLLFDDPITGLDPLVATVVDNEIIKLRDLEDVTSIVVTHQIRDAVYIATHEAVREDGELRIVKSAPSRAHEVKFMVLHEGRLHFEGSAAELLASRDPYLQEYMHKTLPPW
ncbi:MAG: ATP-binding cassette domain-containing protein [Acidobacteria bacterium]|nr:ATP-binding cassette domain-containing protein [Acidobacteriota bacterium]